RRMRTGLRADLCFDQRAHRHRLWRRRSAHQIDMTTMFTRARRNPSLLVGSIIISSVLFVAIFAPLFFQANPFAIDLGAVLAAPSLRHPLGCDSIGRDVLARVLWGARLSIGVSVAVVSVSLVIGSIVGGAA